jgi:hypothetical protein
VADIRDDQVWNERRWRWDGHGYSNAFPKKITPSDIDMIVERRGYFLAAETKEWRPGHVRRPVLPAARPADTA